MVGLGKKRRERYPGFVLVLEHRRKPYHVFVFRFPPRSSRRPRLSAKHDDLYSEFNADSKTQAGLHRCVVFATHARGKSINNGEKRSAGRRLPQKRATFRPADFETFARPRAPRLPWGRGNNEMANAILRLQRAAMHDGGLQTTL